MANILGQLLVELGINTAAFKDGLDKSTYQAKQFAKEMQSELSQVGGGVRALAGEITGKISPAFSGAFNVIGDAFGLVKTSIGGAGTATIAFAGAAIGLGAAAAAAGVGLVALAKEGAEVVHEYELVSEKTGITVRDLQTLKAAGESVGLGLENIVVGYRKFSQSLAETGKGAGAATVVLRALGVTAKDPYEAILQVADAFQKIEDPNRRATDAVLLFGRAGLNLIPVLSKGRDGIKEFSDIVDVFGHNIGKDAVDATENYKKSVVSLGVAWEGVKIAAAPAISFLSDSLTALAGSLTVVAKSADDIGSGKIKRALKELYDLSNGQLDIGPLELTDDSGKPDEKKKTDDENKALKEKRAQQAATQAAQKQAFEEAKADGQAAYALQQKQQEIQEEIAAGAYDLALKAQQQIPALQEAARLEKERKNALFEVPKTIGSEVKRAGSDENKAFTEALRSERDANIANLAATDAAAVAERLRAEAQLKGIDTSKKFTAALAEALPKIERSAFFMEAFKESTKDTKAVETFTLRENESAKALESAGESYGSVTRAQEANKVKLQELGENLGRLTTAYMTAVEQYGVNSAETKRLSGLLDKEAEAYDKATAAVKRHNDALAAKSVNDETKKVDEELSRLNSELTHVSDVGGRGLLDVNERIHEMATSTGLAESAFEGLRGKLEEIHNKQLELKKEQAAISALSSEYSQTLGYDPRAISSIKDDIRQLNKDRAAGLITEKEYQKVLADLNAKYADIQAQTGGIGAGIKAGLQDIVASAKSWGQEMRDITKQAMNGFNQSFAQLVATGRGSFKQLGQSLLEEFVVFGLQKAEAALIRFLARKLGLVAANASAQAGIETGSAVGAFAAKKVMDLSEVQANAAVAATGAYASLAWIPVVGPELGAAAAAAAFAQTEAYGAAAMLADGGVVTPGKAYIVGEKTPELFIPRQPGTVVPRIREGEFGGGKGGGGEMSFHYAPQISTFDGPSVRAVIREHASVFAEEIAGHLRAMNG